ncbi:hypothetical protein [Pedobacter metabolipauper]|uniref:Lipoprotein n=1 Tax=Pedobacter metabolipauper TaxID=425513 RepID=A0A4R6SRE3_9SPHI|nr:hypothetical protein [Pedobacter metabolipauper]TDQ06210.1 hypothetical protein ATK78_4591 [Pedobacter metabolipauper]
MKYFVYLLVITVLFGCNNKCDVIIDRISIPVVFSFIDADSTNLLENNTIDVSKISIKDGNGNIPGFNVVQDSTKTKALYLNVQFESRKGNYEIKIVANNKETSLKYKVILKKDACEPYYDYTYTLNGQPYQLKEKKYFKFNHPEFYTLYHVIYINQ